MRALQILLFLLTWLPTRGQTYFNEVTTDAASSADPDLLVSDSSYVVAGRSTFSYQEMELGVFDLSGQLLQKKSYSFDSIINIANCGNCLSIMGGKYFLGQTTFIRPDSAFVLFYKLNKDLDTVYTSKHIEFEGAQPAIYAMQFDTDSTFIATGLLFRNLTNLYKYDLWVARFDTAFNPLWGRRFEDNHPNLTRGYRGMDIELDAYGSVVVSGEGHNFVNIFGAPDIQYAFAARLERSTGQLHWLKEFSGPVGSRNMFLLDQQDGTYRFVESQILKFFPNSNNIDSSLLRVGILDTAGQVVWDRVLGPVKSRFYIQDFYPTTDGNFYVAGQQALLPFIDLSSGFKFSPQGDTIWYRTYHYQDSADISEIWTFKPTADSGFVHVGIWADFFNTQTNFTHTWFLKTDQYGCDVAGCHTVGLRERFLPKMEILVYPNPSTGKFTIEIPEGEEMRARLFDLKGGKLWEQEIKKGKSRLDVSKKLAPGIYLLQITDRRGNLASRKLVVE